MMPELLRILQHAHEKIEHLNETDYMAHLYAMYLLAQIREPRTYPLLIQFFSTPGDITLDVTGDTVTEDLGRILASVCDGNIEPIKSLIENEQANEFVRYAAVASLVALVACGEQKRDDVIAYFQTLFRGKLVRKCSHVWDALVSASTDLYPEERIGDIELAYQHQLVDSYYMGLDSAQAVLSRAKDDVFFALTANERFQLIDDAICEMEWWSCFQPEDSPSRTAIPDILFPAGVPIRPWRRNRSGNPRINANENWRKHHGGKIAGNHVTVRVSKACRGVGFSASTVFRPFGMPVVLIKPRHPVQVP